MLKGRPEAVLLERSREFLAIVASEMIVADGAMGLGLPKRVAEDDGHNDEDHSHKAEDGHLLKVIDEGEKGKSKMGHGVSLLFNLTSYIMTG